MRTLDPGLYCDVVAEDDWLPLLSGGPLCTQGTCVADGVWGPLPSAEQPLPSRTATAARPSCILVAVVTLLMEIVALRMAVVALPPPLRMANVFFFFFHFLVQSEHNVFSQTVDGIVYRDSVDGLAPRFLELLPCPKRYCLRFADPHQPIQKPCP